MQEPKRKIIQKRNSNGKEKRYAIAARKRCRTINNIPTAQFCVLENSENMENEEMIYKLPMGFVMGEKHDTLYFDPSMLNHNFFANCIDITHDGDRSINIKLQNKIPNLEISLEDGLKTDLLPQLKNAHPLMQELQDVLQKGDYTSRTSAKDEVLKKYNTYLTHRKQLFSTRACYEIRIRVDRNNSLFYEISYSSKILTLSGYDFEEFIETVLKNGIPRLAEKVVLNIPNFEPSTYIKHMVDSFEQPQFLYNLRSISIKNNQMLQKVDCSAMLYGNSVKASSELSIIILVNEVDSIPRTLYPNTSTISFHKRWQELNRKERRQFLKRFYPYQYFLLISSSILSSCASPEIVTETVSLKDESDEMKIEGVKEEFKLLVDIEPLNGGRSYNQILNTQNLYARQETNFPSFSAITYLNILRTQYQPYQ